MKTGKGADERQHTIERFWHNYLSVLEKSNVPKGARRWYRRHIQMYIDTHSGLRLSQHSSLVVDKYLNEKSRMVHLEEWQSRQISQSHVSSECLIARLTVEQETLA